jgi:group I intron endonuclease
MVANRGDLRAGAQLELIAEVGNPSDENAVEVQLKETHERLGYLSRKIAPRYRKLIQLGSISEVKLFNAEWYRSFDGKQQLSVKILIYHDDLRKKESNNKNKSGYLGSGEIPALPGVYMITNDITQRSYIGSSKNIKSRVNQHFRELTSEKHANTLLQKDYLTQQGKGFTAKAIQLLQHPEQCEAAESQAIVMALRQNHKLYNMTEDGQGYAEARFGKEDNNQAGEAISERVNKPQEPQEDERNSFAIMSASKSNVIAPLEHTITPIPQRNPSMRGLWIFGAIILFLWIVIAR